MRLFAAILFVFGLSGALAQEAVIDSGIYGVAASSGGVQYIKTWGSTPSGCSATGNNLAGQITFTGTSCSITWSGRASTPNCVVSLANSTYSGSSFYISAVSSSGMTVVASGSGTYTINYGCLGA